MKIYHDIDAIPGRGYVLTLGTFDGVHCAHQRIIERVVTQAQYLGQESLLITFSPHPRTFVSGAGQPPIALLSSDRQKISELENTGLDLLLIQSFDRDFSELSATEFIEDFLIAKLQPSRIIIGYDHKFGKDRQGDLGLLSQYAQVHGFEIEEIPRIDLHEMSVSSSQIREYLRTGKVQEANALLGRPYSIRGTVVKGLQNGRKLGFPTANIKPDNPDKLVPRDGVYDVDVMIDSSRYKGALNIGLRPSIDQSLQHTIEVYLLDFDEDIYGKELSIEFLNFIRPEYTFSDIQQLKKQIAADVDQVRARRP